MKMKVNVKMRKPVLCLLVLTVVFPLLIFTDRLSSFSSSPGGVFVEEFPTMETITSLSRQLNLVDSDVSTENDSRRSRLLEQDVKLDEESVERKSRVLSTTRNAAGFLQENHIQQVTDQGLKDNPIDNLQRSENQSDKDQPDPQKKEKLEISNQASQQEIQLGRKHGAKVGSAAYDKSYNQVDFPNARVRYLKDQLIQAKVYLSLSATRTNAHFIRELRQRIKEVQKALGDASKDSDLPRNANDKSKAMDQVLAKGKQIQDDCAATVKKLRAILHSTEEQLRVHRKQTMFLTQLTAKTLPKGLHCLPLRLSTEYYALNESQQQFPNEEKLDDPQLYHYALFSDNVLAAGVVVNSTITNAKHPSKHVFHIVTDRLNYAAMKMWFLANPPSTATVHVQNVEEFTWLNASYSPVLKQLGSPSMIDYYFRAHHASPDPNFKFRNPKYLSILNHLRFYLPQIFPKLNKIVFLDDDVVVQKDLSGLWNIDLKGNVNGAVETCKENFHRFDRYLNFSNPLISKNFDPRACGWAYGMNVFDLDEWKKQNITEVYHNWQRLNHNRQLWKLGTLPPGLITFWKRTYALENSWHVLGLGYNPSVSTRDIDRAAVVHYNGNMKPWLEIGISKFRNYWAKYVNYDQAYLRECNINP